MKNWTRLDTISGTSDRIVLLSIPQPTAHRFDLWVVCHALTGRAVHRLCCLACVGVLAKAGTQQRRGNGDGDDSRECLWYIRIRIYIYIRACVSLLLLQPILWQRVHFSFPRPIS